MGMAHPFLWLDCLDEGVITLAWFDNAVFYHIYPLGLTGAPKQNDYGEPEHRLMELLPWIDHIYELGCNALYIGPLFESVGHGYETTDYRKVDSRLGTNEDLAAFVEECHKQGIRVILDAVLNHVGRDFFAFQDLKRNREGSPYRDWFCNVNFWGNNEYNDGFSYDNWGGYNLLVKLNQCNPEVQEYLCDAIRMWVREFDIDGLRLDAADVLDFAFMQTLRGLAHEVKPDFWLMGEVIHGDYTRWANAQMLHSVTDYNLQKALYSGHNDHNYFEIAHTVKRLYDMGLNHPGGTRLYGFVDNHDVERLASILRDKAHLIPTYILLYTLPDIPSVYYGSEFGIEGRKERWSDDSLRPALNLADYADALDTNPLTKVIAALGHLRQSVPALAQGDYRELSLTTRQYAFARSGEGCDVIVTVNHDADPAEFRVRAQDGVCFTGALTGQQVTVEGGCLVCTIAGNSGEVWLPEGAGSLEQEPVIEAVPAVSQPVMPEAAEADAPKAEESEAPVEASKPAHAEMPAESEVRDAAPEPVEGEVPAKAEGHAEAPEPADAPAMTVEAPKPTAASATIPAKVPIPRDKTYEEMSVEELQAVILEKLAHLGPVTDRMVKDVTDNIWHDSLVTWARSF